MLQQIPSKYYRFESTEVLGKQCNIFVNTLKKEKEEMKDKYLRLDQGNKGEICQTRKY